MNQVNLDQIYQDIINDDNQKELTEKGWLPLYTVSSNSKIAIIGQAPSLKTQEKNVPWQDLSGIRLRKWLGVNEETFYNSNIFAQLPMDFYFPGKGVTGDLPPRKGFAEKWHPKIIDNINNLELIILIGNYAQNHYLKENIQKNLTETVRNYQLYLPKFIPIPHPSPLNVRWFKKNPWFEEEVIPILQQMIHQIINKEKQK